MTQQNSKCSLCSEREERINHIISECRKLAQKECKTGNEWVGKVILKEFCKKFNLNILLNGLGTNHNLFWRMRQKILWNFEIQAVLKNTDCDRNRNNRIEDLAISVKIKENRKRDKYLDLAQELKSYAT